MKISPILTVMAIAITGCAARSPMIRKLDAVRVTAPSAHASVACASVALGSTYPASAQARAVIACFPSNQAMTPAATMAVDNFLSEFRGLASTQHLFGKYHDAPIPLSATDRRRLARIAREEAK